jgi:Sulfotransferase family
MSQDFKSLSWEAISNVPAYGRWLLATDQRSAYEYHRLALQVLQSGGVRGRWTLKSPHHAIALDTLTAVYPDAQLVLLHRDPVALCASVCSLITELSGCFTDADHRAYITEHWESLLEESIRRVDAFRVAQPGHPIIDVQYDDLVRDPVGTVAAIYDFFDDPLDPDAEKAMAKYAAANTKGSRGVHGYTLADYGLDAGEITERFSGYINRYVRDR